MLRGVSRSVEGADWLALYVPVTLRGWLSIELPAGWCPRLWRGSKKARAQFSNQVCPLRSPYLRERASGYECDDWY